jgi:hypothetical protein
MQSEQVFWISQIAKALRIGSIQKPAKLGGPGSVPRQR